MCGIAGIIGRPGDEPSLRALIDAMTETLAHRGPDDGGVVVLADQGVALGMRRLSVLDHAGGRQPMWDERRRHCVVFNGEIYNFAPLRRELASRGHSFASDHSDTEVLVHGFEEWGKGLFPRLNGMFAVAIWDCERAELTIARDRMGEKPFYFARLDDGWAFASEVKALMCVPQLNRDLDLVGLDQFFAFDYTVGERTILKAVRKLSSGSCAVIRDDSFTEERYWSPSFDELDMSEADVIAQLDAHLDRSVAERMVADVPVGLFLSGGLDSSTIGYYMCRHSDDVRSFSIGFEEEAFDESSHSRVVAAHLGARHEVEVLSQQRAADIVPRLAEILDEPMADQSILPTYLLSTFARRSVTVALGGDGSDELLMGYSTQRALRAASEFARAPRPLRRAVLAGAARAPRTLQPPGLSWLYGADDSIVGRVLTQMPRLDGFRGDALRVVSDDLRASFVEGPLAQVEAAILDGVPADADWAARATAAYLRGYLAEDILVKVDRASMAASLEVRAPFLDYELVDFLLRIPAKLKLKRLRGKHLLRELMRDRLPEGIADRRKTGFNVPVSAWLRTSLAPLMQDALSHERLRREGIFSPTAVDRLVASHLAGTEDNGRVLWRLLQFELWRSRWLDTPQPLATSVL